jgi:hypothetical protein
MSLDQASLEARGSVPLRFLSRPQRIRVSYTRRNHRRTFWRSTGGLEARIPRDNPLRPMRRHDGARAVPRPECHRARSETLHHVVGLAFRESRRKAFFGSGVAVRRSDHPSRPSARTCCFFSSLKTLLIPAVNHVLTASSTSRPPPISGRFSGVHQWLVLVSTEVRRREWVRRGRWQSHRSYGGSMTPLQETSASL